MKFRFIFIMTAMVLFSTTSAQTIEPVITFNEKPVSYCMHICSDGMYYYTANGGVEEDGRLFKYSLQGDLIGTFQLKLDMRSIMYNKKDKSLYVNTVDKKIYRIIDIDDGIYELVYENLYENEQSSLALDPKGKYIYSMDDGSLSVYKFKTGELVRVLSGLKCGDGNRKGSGAVAVVDKYIYTWDADSKTVYTYNLDGIFVKSFTLKSGDFGYSLSIANNLLFVSHSVQGKTGTWYGYNFPIK